MDFRNWQVSRPSTSNQQRCLEFEQRHGSREIPPNNFRTLSVYPTSKEILGSNPGFVRKNIIRGRYDSTEHYLDVHFRLLREDFVTPLRESLAEYLAQTKGTELEHNFTHAVIHPNVVFRSRIFYNGRMGVLLEFFNKDTHKRSDPQSFNHGSLVLFTKNNFRSILFGRVLDRNVKEKNLTVEFEMQNNDVELNVPYLMVECKVFFEPYYQVLKALQRMPMLDFPMKSYLIDVDARVEPPGYLFPRCTDYTIQNRRVNLYYDNWPTPDELQLNSTQYFAYHAALTTKFVVIQGPPGTGKTHVGLEIVKTLIHKDNRKYWNAETPILIVCFSNHALDHVLEGLLPSTEEIVRVGGQSKNTQLTQYNLNTMSGKTSNKTRQDLRAYNIKLKKFQDQIGEYGDQLKLINSYKHIIAFKHFAVIDRNIITSWFNRASNSELLAWLFAEQSSKITKLDKKELAGSSVVNEKNVTSPDNLTVCESIPNMEDNILELENELSSMVSNPSQQSNFKAKKWLSEMYLDDLRQTLKYFKERMHDGETLRAPTVPHNVNYGLPESMKPNDRWNLYFYWLNSYKGFIEQMIVKLRHEHALANKKYCEIKTYGDVEVMRKKLVIGMTTTGAARLQTTLQALKCPILIVEEAAEVLESHIVVSLTKHCQHLILIGDHKQLRPNPADYRMETKFYLGVSMFERMVLNNMNCHVLDVQHRMRPEIAQLIVPHIYPQLGNHYSVTGFPPIDGMNYNLFFIQHEHQELIEGDSKSNLHEAKFLVNLACYLRNVGYAAEDITILSAYTAQQFVLRDLSKTFPELLKDVRITVLDNYQGEESKIILLSLVRNNRQDSIGFLKIENRICVALSRAKHGLYIMGNMNLLSRNSQIWQKIKGVLVRQNCLGSYLPVHCKVHRCNITLLKDPEDFEKVPDGGCLQECGRLLKCGHICFKTCHMLDLNHTETLCTAPCSKVVCINGHVCTKMCHEECGNCIVKLPRRLKCGHEHALPCYLDPKDIKCKIPVMATLPCGHLVDNKPCSEDGRTWKCDVPCNARIANCGHKCTFLCHFKEHPKHENEYGCREPCENIALECKSKKKHKCKQICSEACLPCDVIVSKSLPNCNHRQDMVCVADVKAAICLKPCKKLLPCNHKCQKKCNQVCGSCDKLVRKMLPTCGHMMRVKCSETPKVEDCTGLCVKRLNCGHLCQKMCNEICTTECQEMIDYDYASLCGHKLKARCFMGVQTQPNSIGSLQNCMEPCTKILACSHQCSGTCGTCFQGRIHTVCSRECEIILICGHKLATRCGESVQFWDHKCSFKCRHADSPSGTEICDAPCLRQCKHRKCKATCWEKCSVKPCECPCNKKLKCKHPCVGFCGEPCPQLCRICDRKDFPSMLLGFEDKKHARFVELDECKHVLEGRGLESWFHREDTKNGVLVDYKRCPKCKIPLQSTQRYSDYIKETMNDAVNIQIKIFGRCYERKSKQDQLMKMLDSLEDNFRKIKTAFPLCFPPCMQVYRSILKNQDGSFNLLVAQDIEIKLTIIQRFYEIFNFKSYLARLGYAARYSSQNNVGYYERFTSVSSEIVLLNDITSYWSYLAEVITVNVVQFTNQTMLDVEREMLRLQRMKHILDILIIASNSVLFTEIKELVFRPVPYTERYDAQVKVKLEELYKNLDTTVPDLECLPVLQGFNSTGSRWFKSRGGHYFKN